MTMRVTKCDKCKRTIKTRPLQVGFGFCGTDLCKFCSEALVDCLIAMNILEKEIKVNKYRINKKVGPVSSAPNLT
jgi:hypothetical protein